MADFHVNPDTGRTGYCFARKRCRFGADTPHYETREAAAAGYEASMKEQEIAAVTKKAPEQKAPKEVPPVRTPQQLDMEASYFKNHLEEGQTLGDVLADTYVGKWTVQQAEEKGTYQVPIQFPGNFEMAITSDLARRELGMPRRSETSESRPFESFRPIPTDETIQSDKEYVTHQLGDKDIRTAMRENNVTPESIEKQEEEGKLTVFIGNAGDSKVNISTDLARKELGMPARTKDRWVVS